MNPGYARVRDYLQSQGAKLEPPAIIDKVRTAMADLRTAATKVPPARFAERPAPEEWSGNEVLAHVVAAGMFGPLNWRETLLFMRLHDLDHAGQLDKIATALS